MYRQLLIQAPDHDPFRGLAFPSWKTLAFIHGDVALWMTQPK